MAIDVQRVSFGRATLGIGPANGGSQALIQIDGGVTLEYKLDSKPVKAPQLSDFPLGDIINSKEFSLEAVLKDVGADLAYAFGLDSSAGGFSIDDDDMVFVSCLCTIYTHPELGDSVEIDIPYAAVTSQGSTDLNDDEGGHGFVTRFEARKYDNDTAPVTFAYITAA